MNLNPQAASSFSCTKHISHTLKLLCVCWKSVFLFALPLALLPIIILNPSPPFRCMYIVINMALFWATETLPLPVVSIIPMFAFPLFGIMGTDATCKMYMKETVVMFIASMMLACAIEFSNLHKRIALKTILFIGCSHRRLSFGLQLVTMFISFWIVNTAATAMMIPIILAVLEELEIQGVCRIYEDIPDNEKEFDVLGKELKKPTKITISYFVGVAYSSTLGGTATIIGTGTNLTLKGLYENRFPQGEEMNFLKFMACNVPMVLVMTVLTWVWLQFAYMGMFRPDSEDAKKSHLSKEGEAAAKRVLIERYKELGKMTGHEIGVLTTFLFCILLFFTRSPGFMTGWAVIQPETQIKDGTTAMIAVFILFVLPMKWDFVNIFFNSNTEIPKTPSPGMLVWSYLHANVPWGFLFLLGGGFALAEGARVSGMSTLIGEQLVALKSFNPWAIVLIVVILAEFLTEFTANVPIANIVLPVLAEMAIVINIHPMYLMYPAGLACSMAFHTPVGTPPNAIICTPKTGITIKDLLFSGLGPTVITVIVLSTGFPLWGSIIYPEYLTVPDWLEAERQTTTISP